MSDTAPTVSVIMAAYNGATIISETIDSLRAQTMTDFEVVIVDDCSTDETLAVLNAIDDPRFRIVAAPVNQGVVLSRNLAVAQARGRYIAALDHDDLCRPDRFARQVAYLEANPDTVLVATAADILYEGAIIPPTLSPVTTPTLIDWLLQIENPLVWSSVMMRGDAARRLDPFMRPDLLFAEDFDLYHRIAHFGAIARIDEPLLIYRRHIGSASQQQYDRMRARATDVLATAHARLFGDEAPELAGLIMRHVMGQSPVPDATAYRRVGEALVALQEDFIATRAPDAESLKLIRWETAQRWGRIGRAGLRSGAIGLGDAIAVRPDHLGLGYAGIDQLIMSRLVGGARTARSALRRAGFSPLPPSRERVG